MVEDNKEGKMKQYKIVHSHTGRDCPLATVEAVDATGALSEFARTARGLGHHTMETFADSDRPYLKLAHAQITALEV